MAAARHTRVSIHNTCALHIHTQSTVNKVYRFTSTKQKRDRISPATGSVQPSSIYGNEASYWTVASLAIMYTEIYILKSC